MVYHNIVPISYIYPYIYSTRPHLTFSPGAEAQPPGHDVLLPPEPRVRLTELLHQAIVIDLEVQMLQPHGVDDLSVSTKRLASKVDMHLSFV